MAAWPESTIKSHYEIEDAVEHLYDVTIFDRTILTTVTKYPEAVTNWIESVDSDENNTSMRYIGVEAELYLNQKKESCLATFQMCDGKRCLIYQLVNAEEGGFPHLLPSFLDHEDYGFFGIDIKSKLKMLGELLSFEPEPEFKLDLGDVARMRYDRAELKSAEQSELVLTTLGVNVEKPHVDHTEWGYPGRLSQEQVHYACLEAFLSLEVGRWLNNNRI